MLVTSQAPTFTRLQGIVLRDRLHHEVDLVPHLTPNTRFNTRLHVMIVAERPVRLGPNPCHGAASYWLEKKHECIFAQLCSNHKGIPGTRTCGGSRDQTSVGLSLMS